MTLDGGGNLHRMRKTVAVAALLSIPVLAFASETRGPNRAFRATGKPASSVERALDAASLAFVGRAGGPPELLVAAAKLAEMAAVQPTTRAKRTEGAEPAAAQAPLPLDYVKLLEEAAAAAQRAGFADLERHSKAISARPLPPPAKARTFAQSERIAAGAADTFEIAFAGNELAQVGIAGAGAADLDLAVMDDRWNVVCASSSDTAREYCSWIPAATGTFRIRISNPGPATDDYVLVTN